MENSKAVAIEDIDDFDKNVYQNSLSITSKGNLNWFGDFDNLQGLFNNFLNKHLGQNREAVVENLKQTT